MQYKWLGGEHCIPLFSGTYHIVGSEPVGYEGELQLSQFDLKETFFRELNFTRSESSECDFSLNNP